MSENSNPVGALSFSFFSVSAGRKRRRGRERAKTKRVKRKKKYLGRGRKGGGTPKWLKEEWAWRGRRPRPRACQVRPMGTGERNGFVPSVERLTLAPAPGVCPLDDVQDLSDVGVGTELGVTLRKSSALSARSDGRGKPRHCRTPWKAALPASHPRKRR